MFNTLTIHKKHLPDGVPTDAQWQTKDGPWELLMHNMEIKEDGSLVFHTCEYEFKEKEKIKDNDFGFHMHPINKRTETTNWSGEIYFYDTYNDKPLCDNCTKNDCFWIELKAVFHDGKIQRVEIVQDERNQD